MRVRWISAFSLIALLASSCSSTVEEPIEPSQATTSNTAPATSQADSLDGDQTRLELTHHELTSGEAPRGLVDESAFAPGPASTDTEHRFQGTLELLDEANGQIEVVQGDPDVEPELGHLPDFRFDFVQVDNRLVPVDRGLILTTHTTWNYYLEPGTVWEEPEDGGMARAAIPFALVPKGGNSTYNGTLTFLFDETETSHVRYQIAQETSFSFRANFYGVSRATYTPRDLTEAEAVTEAFRTELANRLPTKPIADLSVDYPDIDSSGFGAGLSPADRTFYGVVVDGVNYLSPCNTRAGEYVHCQEMRSPSWSTAKSAFAGVAMMRLAEEFGEAVPDSLIRELVPEADAAAGDWSDTTINHTLDMATGNYESTARMQDEDQFATHPFWGETEYDPKIRAAFNWPEGSPPGETWVYHTADTFIATTAMGNYLESQRPGSDLFEYVVEDVFEPLGMGPGVASTLRTSDDNWNGHPYGGYGLWWIPDDLAKVSEMLHRLGTGPGGEQLISADLVAASLQRNPADRGVQIDERNYYNNGFWATRYGQPQGYDCEFWVVQMQGITGVVVILMPNDTTYYYVSDGRQFTWDGAVRESNRIRPHCGAG